MRRFALRRLRTDEGLGLIETVSALFVFSLIMTGLAGSMIVFAHSTTLGRARASASSLAQQYVEKARAVGASLLENCDNTTPAPPNTTSFHGKTGLTVVKGSDANCIKWQTTTTQDNLNFSVTRLVILAQPSQNDVAGQAQSEKYLVVQVSWTDAGGAAKTYELDTIFNQKGATASAPAQGIRFVIKDINGNIITADSATWSVKITDTTGNTLYTASDAATAEGTYSQLDLSPGTYTCTAQSTSDASSGYFPGAHPTYNSSWTLSSSNGSSTNDTVSGSCTVSTNTVTDFVTTWQSLTDCATSSVTGTVNFLVTNQTTKAALSGMTVTMTNLNDSSKTYTKNTGANGHADGLKPVANWYTYTVTDPTGAYVTGSFNAPYCVIAGSTVTINVQMTASGNCATSGTNATVNITVQDASTGTKLGGYKVSVVNANTGTTTGFPNTSPQGLSSKAITPGSYYYMVTPPGSSTYQGSGVQGPTCFTPGETRNITVGLTSALCTRNAGKKTAGATFLVTDMAGNKISGATIELFNVNGDQPLTSATTDVNGAKTFTGLPVDPYQYVVVGPNGNYQTSDVSPTVCLSDGVTTSLPTVKLSGIMNVTVTVQNNDVVPWKNYEIDVIDASGNTAGTQYVTVPDCTPGTGCTRNPSSGLTFTGLTTGSYMVQVCAFMSSSSNCNLVDTAPSQSGTTNTYYQFLTPGATYTSSTTGYGDLATVDDTGGA